ncbi:hypothetical protein OPW39_15905 [Vibrio europaeus]|uniref:hypothetical protein n=1 Tax=Vibrio europaeus TaxID=300876 RepID=UPI00233F7AC0|nr:hypothetical protein [Vibrio europaeus]MDC5870293.1 hypothetical protein [Vibrio europaeus]
MSDINDVEASEESQVINNTEAKKEAEVSTQSEPKAPEGENLPEVDKAPDAEKERKKKIVGLSILFGSILAAASLSWGVYNFVYLPYELSQNEETQFAQEAAKTLISTDDDVVSIGDEEDTNGDEQELTDIPLEEDIYEDDDDYEDEFAASGVDVEQINQLIQNFNDTSTAIAQSISAVRNDVSVSHGDLKNNLKVIADNQKVLAESTDAILKNQKSLQSSIASSNKKLDVLLKGLESLREAGQMKDRIIPVSVYSSGSWGSEKYLTVAPKEHPSQSYKLYVGQSVGAWKLESISDAQAMFKHVSGLERAVQL